MYNAYQTVSYGEPQTVSSFRCFVIPRIRGGGGKLHYYVIKTHYKVSHVERWILIIHFIGANINRTCPPGNSESFVVWFLVLWQFHLTSTTISTKWTWLIVCGYLLVSYLLKCLCTACGSGCIKLMAFLKHCSTLHKYWEQVIVHTSYRYFFPHSDDSTLGHRAGDSEHLYPSHLSVSVVKRVGKVHFQKLYKV